MLQPVSLVGLVVCLCVGLLMRTWQETLLGVAVGFGSMFLLYILGILFSRWRNKRLGNVQDGEEALGSGDVTLAILLGLLLGWPLILVQPADWHLTSGCFQFITINRPACLQEICPLMVFISFGPFFILTAFFLLIFSQFDLCIATSRLKCELNRVWLKIMWRAAGVACQNTPFSYSDEDNQHCK